MALQDLLNKAKVPTKSSGLSALLERAKQGIPIQEPQKSVDEKGGMIFRVGEGLTPQQTERAKEVISKPIIPIGQEIKTPFFPSGTVVPSGGGVGVGFSLLKSIIEFPERAARSLAEFGGITKQKEEKQWRVPSYTETASKETGQLIDEGIPPIAAVILGSAKVGGEFANDALIFDFVLGSAARKVAKTVVSPSETQTVAYDFLGRPKTLAQAEANFKNIQRQFHPDISGTDKISKQANNAITILRKNGIPNQSVLKEGLDRVLNRPLSQLFKAKSIPTSAPTAPTLKLAEKASFPKPPPPKPVEAPITPKTAPETAIAPKVEIVPKDLESLAVGKKSAEITPAIVQETTPKVVKVPGEQLPVKTEGETQISRLEARQRELLNKITPEQAKEAGLSTFEQMNKKEQISKATQYVSQNPNEALKVVEGRLPPPKDLLTNSIALALETHAEMVGNANLIAKLASLRSTRFGQEISILTEADPLNVVSVSRNIQVARETATIKRLGKKIGRVKQETDEVISKVIKEERTLAQIKVAEAEKLLESITC